jgi:hypothetical protein
MCLAGFIGEMNQLFDDKWIATASGHKEDDKTMSKSEPKTADALAER